MPHLYRCINDRIWKPGQAATFTLADGSSVEAIWGGSAQEEKLAWWLRKPGSLLAQTEEISGVAVKGEDDGEVRWGSAPPGARLLFVLEPPTISRTGVEYRLAKMVTVAATPAQQAYFRDTRFSLFGRLHRDGSLTRLSPLPPPVPSVSNALVQGELF